jgi:sorbitol-specific phosphotransferase system component IIBC
MELERETVREAVVSFVAVAAFVAVVVYIGMTYGGTGDFSADGALALLGAIVGFILLMFGVGLLLSGE